MSTIPFKTFIHPSNAYQLDYPAPWEHLQQDDAKSCGFGPRDRDDVGLWISILPASVDTDRLVEDLPKLMQQAISKFEATQMRKDPTLRHYALKADITKEGEAGHYWIIAGGDLVLFASSQVPAAERDVWNPAFEKLMASLQIMRDDELLMRQVANEVLEELRKRHPDQEFEFDEKGIRGPDRVVYLSNVYREVREAPHRRHETVRRFVDGLEQSSRMDMGYEVWEEVCRQILPVLKPRDYIHSDGPTQHLFATEWLADVLICYAIKNKKVFRYLTGWDLNRWEISGETLHNQALENLAQLPWPRRLEGSRQRDGGRVTVVATDDGISSSRLLHPDFHRLFSGPLGSPFWAGIPDRNSLVAFSDRRQLKKRIARQLRKDFQSSAYAITPLMFLVTCDGVAAPDDA